MEGALVGAGDPEASPLHFVVDCLIAESKNRTFQAGNNLLKIYGVESALLSLNLDEKRG